MLERIEQLKNKAKKFSIENLENLENYRLTFLSKKGDLNILFEEFKIISGEEKREIGKQLNLLRQELELIFSDKREKFSGEAGVNKTNVAPEYLPYICK